MDKSEECENKNEINHNSSHYNNSEVIDKSISDPIPSLFLPIKKNKKSKIVILLIKRQKAIKISL